MHGRLMWELQALCNALRSTVLLMAASRQMLQSPSVAWTAASSVACAA